MLRPVCFTLLLIGLILTSCVSRSAQTERYAALTPTRYVVVLPEGRSQWPCVKRFLSWKSAQGFAVEVLEFAKGGSRSKRFAAVSADLERRRPRLGDSAFVLILATPDQLPMGPWNLAEGDPGVLSDWPLLAGVRRRKGTLTDDEWLDATRYPQRWIAGRIPFKTRRYVAAALRAAERFTAHAINLERTALLGAERIGVPFDSALVLDSVRSTLRQAKWTTTLLSQDVPRDDSLTRLTRPAPQPKSSPQDPDEEVHFTFLGEWAKSAPQLVYLIAHSTLLKVDNGLFEEHWYGIGQRAIDPISYLIYRSTGHLTVRHPRTPKTPAVLIATGCRVARPDNSLIAALFRDGWIAGYCGSTTDTGPLPPAAAVRAELNLPYYLARGLPIGQAMHATADAYLTESAWDPITTLLWPWAEPMRRENILSWMFYGDPSLQLANNDRFHPHGPLRSHLMGPASRK